MKSLKILSIVAALSSACMAHAPASAPVLSDDEWINLDRSIPASGPVCNRMAFEVLGLRQKIDARAHKLELLDCNERATLAETRAERRLEELQHAAWWSRWGAPLVAIGLSFGAVIGGLAVYGLERGLHAAP